MAGCRDIQGLQFNFRTQYRKHSNDVQYLVFSLVKSICRHVYVGRGSISCMDRCSITSYCLIMSIGWLVHCLPLANS